MGVSLPGKQLGPLTEGHTCWAAPSLEEEQAGLSAFAPGLQSMTTDLPEEGARWKGNIPTEINIEQDCTYYFLHTASLFAFQFICQGVWHFLRLTRGFGDFCIPILETMTAAETHSNAAFIITNLLPPSGRVLLLQLQKELLPFPGLDQWL